MQVAYADNWPGSLPPVRWTGPELLALAPPANVTVTEWADQHRRLSAKFHSIHGRWETARTPYLKEVQNAFSDPRVEEISIKGPVQSGKTAGELNMIAWAVDVDPGPMMIIGPKSGWLRRFIKEDIHPLFIDSEKLHEHIRDFDEDLLTTGINLDTMVINIASANNVDELASKAIRYLFLEEVNKYKEWAGTEASPVELGKKRVTSFIDAGAKIVKSCTPTTKEGVISVEYEKSTKERFYVPCPHCDFFQVLLFGNKKTTHGLKWKGGRDADPDTVTAEYYCQFCGEAVEDRHKKEMLRRGKWVSEKYQKIDAESGRITGELPRDRLHRGFWWNALYSPFLTFAHIVREFLKAQGRRQALMDFRNSVLAEDWEEIEVQSSAGELEDLRGGCPEKIVPARAVALTCGVDMQKDHFYFTVYAWTLDYKSHLIEYGRLLSWENIVELVYDRTWEQEGTGKHFRLWRTGLDTGGGMRKSVDSASTRTREAYEFILRHGRDRIFATKGLGKKTEGGMIRFSIREKSPDGKRFARPLTIAYIDTDQSKDLFFDRLNAGNRQRIHFHSKTSPEFMKHLTAEHKEVDPRTGKGFWVEDSKTNHYLDCSLIAHAVADQEWKGGLVKAFAQPKIIVNHVRPSRRRAA